MKDFIRDDLKCKEIPSNHRKKILDFAYFYRNVHWTSISDLPTLKCFVQFFLENVRLKDILPMNSFLSYINNMHASFRQTFPNHLNLPLQNNWKFSDVCSLANSTWYLTGCRSVTSLSVYPGAVGGFSYQEN